MSDDLTDVTMAPDRASGGPPSPGYAIPRATYDMGQHVRKHRATVASFYDDADTCVHGVAIPAGDVWPAACCDCAEDAYATIMAEGVGK